VASSWTNPFGTPGILDKKLKELIKKINRLTAEKNARNERQKS